MDANLHQWYQQNGYGNGQWKDYSTGWVQYNTTPVHGYEVLDSEKLAYTAPGSPLPISATSVSTTVTPVTTTGGSTPRRLLSDDERRHMCEYHESHPGVKQTEIGAMFGVERSTVSKVLRNKEKFLYSNDGGQNPANKAEGKFPGVERASADQAKNKQAKGKPPNNSKIRKASKRPSNQSGAPRSVRNQPRLLEGYLVGPLTSGNPISPVATPHISQVQRLPGDFHDRFIELCNRNCYPLTNNVPTSSNLNHFPLALASVLTPPSQTHPPVTYCQGMEIQAMTAPSLSRQPQAEDITDTSDEDRTISGDTERIPTPELDEIIKGIRSRNQNFPAC